MTRSAPCSASVSVSWCVRPRASRVVADCVVWGRLEAADTSHKEVREALLQQVEDLQKERRTHLQRLEQQQLVAKELKAQVEAARQADAQAMQLGGLPEEAEEEGVNEGGEGDEEVEGDASSNGGDVQTLGDNAARWAHHPAVAALGKGEMGARSPRGRKAVGGGGSKHTIFGNKEVSVVGFVAGEDGGWG